MTIESQKSAPVLVLDIPEVRVQSSEFVYNFYTSDERKKSSVVDPNTIPLDGKQAAKSLSRQARYVRLTWSKPEGRTKKLPPGFIRANGLSILSEEHFSSDTYTSITVSDTAIFDKVAQRTPEVDVNSELVQQILADEKSENVKFLNEKLAENFRSLLVGAAVDVQVSNKVADIVLSKATVEPTHTLSFEYVDAANIASRKPKNAKQNENFIFEPIEIEPLRSDLFSADIVGYAVDRYRYKPGQNSLERVSTIIVDDPLSLSLYDTDVLYGYIYRYVVRVVAYVKVPALDSATAEKYTASFLVSSRPTAPLDIDTRDLAAPPPPTDFSVVWNYAKGQPMLVWSFPPNSRGDIKHFQCFRRTKPTEPFELFRQFSFQDPDNEFYEDVDDRLIAKIQSQSCHDDEHKIGQEVIYCVVAVDAHGLTSPYSEQLAVKFDIAKNRLSIRQVSPKGAPKQFPNLFFDDNSYRDSIQVPAMADVDVICAPDAIQLIDSSRKIVSRISVDGNGSYKISVLDPNSASSKTTTINLKTKPIVPPEKGIDLFAPDYGDRVSRED